MSDWAKHFDGALDVQPPLADSQLHQVPAKRGLLLLAGEGERPLILLSSADIRGRLRGRLQEVPDAAKPSRRADLRQITRRVCWRLTDSHFETDLFYLQAARSIWPEGFVKLLPWRAGCFVHVEAQAEAPHFARAGEIIPPPPVSLGPFRDGQTAQKFIETIEDAFDLCRDVARLRRSPRAQPCAYRQMGRCCGVCEGAVSMEEYRRLVARAAEFAKGDRTRYIAELTSAMKQAAADLRFERASALKAKLTALAELTGPAYRHVAEGEQFQFIIIQRGKNKKTLKAFLADRGAVVAAGTLALPARQEELERASASMVALAADPLAEGKYDKWRTALLARYLYSAPQRSGLIVRWTPAVTAAQLTEHIDRWTGAHLAEGGSHSC